MGTNRLLFNGKLVTLDHPKPSSMSPPPLRRSCSSWGGPMAGARLSARPSECPEGRVQSLGFRLEGLGLNVKI